MKWNFRLYFYRPTSKRLNSQFLIAFSLLVMKNKRRKEILPTLQGPATSPNGTAARYKTAPNATALLPPQELISPPDPVILKRPCTIRQALHRTKKADVGMYNLVLGGEH